MFDGPALLNSLCAQNVSWPLFLRELYLLSLRLKRFIHILSFSFRFVFFFDRLSDCLLMSYQEHQAKLTVFPSLGLVIVLGQWLVPVLFRYSFISSCTHLVLNIISLSHAFDICS